MQPVKDPALVKKYRRMIRIWGQRYGNGEKLPIPADGEFPPKRWGRDERVKEIMVARFGQRYIEYRDLFKRAMAKEVVPEWPIHMDFDVLDSCNLACPNCTENFRDWTHATLDMEWLRNDPFFAKKKLFAANVGNACEPFLRPDLALELVRFLRANDIIDIFFHTNGLLLDREMIDQLIESEVTWMSVSIDAFSDETFKLTRGKGYQKVVDNIHLIIERREALGKSLPFIRVSSLLLPENYQEAQGFFDYWKKYADMIEFQNYGVPNPIGVDRHPYVEDTGLYEHLTDSQCGMPFYRMAINPSGAVGPCCSSYGHLDELRLGDVSAGKSSVEEMWNGWKVRMLRSEHLKPGGPQAFKTCVQCLDSNYHFKYYSEGDTEL